MKKISILALSISVVLGSIPSNVFAYEYPHAIWAIKSNYETAKNQNNLSDIITYAGQMIDLMANEPDVEEKKNVMVTSYRDIGLSYAKLGDYANSASTYDALYQYADHFGSEFHDDLVIAKAKVNQYTPVLQMYTDNGTSPYLGAKNEKENGVLFGLCVTAETRNMLDNESMVLLYQEIGQDLNPYNTAMVRKAAESGRAILFALNCPQQAEDICNVERFAGHFEKISNLFKEHPDTPFYLRFGAEFDIWANLSDSESYKKSYRYVSDYFKSRNPNVAIVWNPNQVSNWNLNIDDYYPGDEYVDWVGMSSYAMKYFLGEKNQDEDHEIVFKTGVNSNPVIAVKDIIEEYGDRKPIMLTESGCGHCVQNHNEDTTNFALQRLREYYLYLPMVYPQIKLIAYFDWYVSGETNDYRLSNNQTLQNEFLKLTKTGRFIQDGFAGESNLCYRRIGYGTQVDSVFHVSSYAHMYKDNITSVTYFLDGNYVATSSELPFTAYIDATQITGGNHILKAVALSESGQTIQTEENISIVNHNENDITVRISDDVVAFDQNPVLYNNRTLVPMRKIFEALGAEVSWDNATKTAIGTQGNKRIQLTIGSTHMYVNDKKIALDTPPIMLSNRTLVPARAVAEGLGCDVHWDNHTSTVLIKP